MAVKARSLIIDSDELVHLPKVILSLVNAGKFGTCEISYLLSERTRRVSNSSRFRLEITWADDEATAAEPAKAPLLYRSA